MEASTMSQRREFMMFASQPQRNVRALCRRFGISPQTAYRWIRRVQEQQQQPQPPLPPQRDPLENRSRRPHRSPGKTQPSIEQRVCELRRRHPAWGGRKIHARLLAMAEGSGDGDRVIPAASTITDILRRHGLIDPAESHKHTPFVRFEHAQPNDLWQMDFLGHFPLDDGNRCHTLTVIDDHSRFCLTLKACANETGATVQQHLSSAFGRYGLPRRILSDNGSPWGCDSVYRYTWLSAWLIQLGIGISHGRPYHPQTQGKDERFNRTFKAEVIGSRRFRDLTHVQDHADPWRDVYNLQRPHEALAMNTPATRYLPSPREFPQRLPPIEYGPGDLVRRVQADGYLHYRNVRYKISQAFVGHPVALRPTRRDGQLAVFFCHQQVATIDVRSETRIG
jgi:transposase InsO family protein